MEEVVMFKAEDGKMFENADDCVSYEFELAEQEFRNHGVLLQNELLLFTDFNSKPADLFKEIDFGDFNIVVFKSQQALDYFVKACESLEVTVDGIDDIGGYYYSHKDWKWKKISEKIEKLRTELNNYLQIQKYVG